MNRDLLEALAAISGSFYCEALDRYPGLLLDASRPLEEEALVAWRVLMAIDELAPVVQAALEFDDAKRRQPEGNGVVESDLADLPF